MNITHHIGEDILYGYASGELAYGWNLAIATHLALCPQCRAHVRALEDVLAAGLANETPQPLAKLTSDAVIALADKQAEELAQPPARPKMTQAPVIPQPLRDLCGDVDDIGWQRLGIGLRQRIVHRSQGITARLLYISAGCAVPAHGHNGLELTQVLAGGYYDGDQAFVRGDIQIVAYASPHQPIAMAEAACICLAITDAPIRFRNLIPKLLQPFCRI